MTRRARWSVPIAIATVLALAGTAYAAITISPSVHRRRPARRWAGTTHWNYGNSLEKSTCGDTTYLNALYATDFVKGEFASDSGPYQGAYATRANIAGSPLAGARRSASTPATQHAERTTLAADANDVYAGYVSQVELRRLRPGRQARLLREGELRLRSDVGRGRSRLAGHRPRRLPDPGRGRRHRYAIWVQRRQR